MEILASHKILIDPNFIIETVRSRWSAASRSPDKLETEEDDKLIAQRRLNENLVLRVVYREFNTFISIITLYPGKRSRYEKD
jgi:hypothetical protein